MKIIAFEGIDQSGKETQAKMLAQNLIDRGFTVFVEHFPRDYSPIGRLVRRVLDREQDGISEKALHMLFEADRQDFNHNLQQLDEVYDFCILDRYILSNLAYGLARGYDYTWMRGLQSGLREPDLTFVLDITSDTAFRRKAQGRDINESNMTLLNRSRVAYQVLGDKLGDAYREDMMIRVVGGDSPVDLIHEEILDYTNKTFNLPEHRFS